MHRQRATQRRKQSELVEELLVAAQFDGSVDGCCAVTQAGCTQQETTGGIGFKEQKPLAGHGARVAT